jgi:hypothetical protein
MVDKYHAFNDQPPQTKSLKNQVDLFGPSQESLIVNSAEIGRYCRRCNGETWIVGAGSGPHAASVTCISCVQHGGWLPRDEAEALLTRAAS